MKLIHIAVVLVVLLAYNACSLRTHERAGAFIGYNEHDSAGTDHEILLINSTYGLIRVHLRPDLAPKTVSLVKQLATRKPGACKACTFYRHEPCPQNFGKDNFYGPPYALLQGSLADLAEQPPFEGNPPVKKGDVCMIPNCREFFIATADHVEWKTSHTVWGQVADEGSWSVINSFPFEPYTTRTDGSNITTRWLTQAAMTLFALSMEEQQGQQQQQNQRLRPS